MRSRQKSRLVEHYFVELHPFAQHLSLVDHEAREILVHQPEANEGVSLGQDKDWVQPGLLFN